MCTVSNIGDSWGQTVPAQYPWATTPVVNVQEVSRAEFDALRHEMAELRKLLVAAKAFDAATGQPDCETDDKVALIKRLAALVDVDMADVFGDDSV